MTDSTYLLVTGRLVQGDVFVPQIKNMQGGPLTNLKGEPKVQYFIGVAVPKTDPQMLQEYAKIQVAAQSGFPGGESQRPDFAWKIVDGDLPQHAKKVGFPGHYVFRFTSGFAIPAYTKGAETQIVESSQIKRGYHIRVAFTVKPNGNLQKPGLYLNAAIVELVGYDDEISSGPDAATVFGAAGAAALPAGASATPVASGPPLAPPAMAPPVMAPPAMAPPAMAPPAMAPPAMAPPGIVPAPDFLAPPTMTALAAGQSYQQFIDAGWTKEQLIEQGYMLVPF